MVATLKKKCVTQPPKPPNPSSYAGFGPDAEKWQRFKLFNEQGGKFRVGIINRCNLNCFFCHNEGMPNPRSERDRLHFSNKTDTKSVLQDKLILSIINAWTGMGGLSVNLTGGEPLLHPDFAGFIAGIDKRNTKIHVNSNLLSAGILLRQPLISKIDAFYVSLHTTMEKTHTENLGGGSAYKIMQNILQVKDHGYKILINCSIGPHNIADFPGVLDFALKHRIDLKVIALVRHTELPNYYRGEWINPDLLNRHLESAGVKLISTTQSLGGNKNNFQHGTTRVIVKNIAQGRLITDFCKNCRLKSACGEGIYGLRTGVDGIWKPCLLRKEKYSNIEIHSLKTQLLNTIDAMMGDAVNRKYNSGEPS